jgi:hypothetical protein
MDVKAAVALAQNHITDLFAQEGLTNLGLEEVEYDEARDQWRITVGFSRSWDNQGAVSLFTPGGIKRTYKVVILDTDGKAISVKNRETADAG